MENAMNASSMSLPREVSGTLDIWKDETGADANRADTQVDKRDSLSREEFLHEYVLKNRPVVLKDAARQWPALSKWTPAFFQERYGSKQVPVFERKRSVTLKNTIALSDYIDGMTAATGRAQ